jgi:hypothetical protein
MAKRFPVLRKIIFGWLLSHVVTLGLGQNQPLTLASVRSLQSMQDTADPFLTGSVENT